MIRVLVAEDSRATREYLVYLLEQDRALHVVGSANDGAEAVDQAERLRPDVILMDVLMPELNGLETADRLATRLPTTRILLDRKSVV